MKDEEALSEYRVWASKSIFLIATFSFFLNIFLVGSDKSNSYIFLESLLPITYSFFIASLLFLSISAIGKLFTWKMKKHKKIAYYAVIALFILPLLVFFVTPESFTKT